MAHESDEGHGTEGSQRAERPTPVRELMDGSRRAPAAERSELEVELDGGRWRVRALGLTRSGAPPDTGAPLLLVAFTPVIGDEGRTREALAVAESLDEMTLDQLEDLFASSRRRPASSDRPGRGSDVQKGRKAR